MTTLLCIVAVGASCPVKEPWRDPTQLAPPRQNWDPGELPQAPKGSKIAKVEMSNILFFSICRISHFFFVLEDLSVTLTFPSFPSGVGGEVQLVSRDYKSLGLYKALQDSK